MGTALGLPHMSDHGYVMLDYINYSLITAENACKMYSIAKSETEFDASDCRKLKNSAMQYT
jgi:hypothetical protein